MAVLMSLANHTPILPQRHRPEIPDALADLIMWLLEKLPGDRPSCADDVVKALIEIEPSNKDSVPVDAASVKLPGLQSKETIATTRADPRNRWAIVAGVIVLLSIIAVAIWFATRSKPQPTSPEQEQPKERGRSERSINPDNWNREVAEHVLEAGGTVQYHFPAEEKTTDVNELRLLPSVPFRIQMITLEKIDRVNDVMDWIHDLDQFNCLSVKNCPLDDAGVAKLHNLPHFEWLIIKNTQVTGTGFAALRALPLLRWLDIVDAPITDEGLSFLPELPNLDRLVLQGTKITGPGLKRLAKVPSLKRLSITRCSLSDAGLGDLPSLPKLTDLVLDGTSVSDVGLIGMNRQPALSHLYLVDTGVTQRGVDEFRKKLMKDCEIVFGPRRKSK